LIEDILIATEVKLLIDWRYTNSNWSKVANWLKIH